jgi:hypothetical protein
VGRLHLQLPGVAEKGGGIGGYREWCRENFSGVLCVDEVHEGSRHILFASERLEGGECTDPRTRPPPVRHLRRPRGAVRLRLSRALSGRLVRPGGAAVLRPPARPKPLGRGERPPEAVAGQGSMRGRHGHR